MKAQKSCFNGPNVHHHHLSCPKMWNRARIFKTISVESLLKPSSVENRHRHGTDINEPKTTSLKTPQCRKFSRLRQACPYAVVSAVSSFMFSPCRLPVFDQFFPLSSANTRTHNIRPPPVCNTRTHNIRPPPVCTYPSLHL